MSPPCWHPTGARSSRPRPSPSPPSCCSASRRPLTTTRFDVLPVLKDEGTTSTAARGPARLRRSLVVAQVALSLTLLVTAGLFFQSLSRTLRVDPGFDPQGLVIVSFDLNLQGYTPERRAAFADAVRRTRVRDAGRHLGGHRGHSPARRRDVRRDHRLRRWGIVGEGEPGAASRRRYFETFGLPVVRGREFSPAEVAANAPVAIVNETLARTLWPGVDPLGKQRAPGRARKRPGGRSLASPATRNTCI